MARYGSLSVFLTCRSEVTVTWANSLKSPSAGEVGDMGVSPTSPFHHFIKSISSMTMVSLLR